MALCGNGAFPLSSSNPDQQTASMLRGEKNDLMPQPGTWFPFFLSHTTWAEGKLEKKKGWKRKGGESQVVIKNKLVRAQRRVRRKPLARRGIRQPGSDAHEGESHAEGGPGGGRDSAHVHQLVHRGFVYKRLGDGLRSHGIKLCAPLGKDGG